MLVHLSHKYGNRRAARFSELWKEYRLLALAVLMLIPIFPAWRYGLAAFTIGAVAVVANCIIVALLFKDMPYRVSFSLVFTWLVLTVLFAIGASSNSTIPLRSTARHWRGPLCYLAFLLCLIPIAQGFAATSQHHEQEAAIVAKDFEQYAPPVSRVHVWWASRLPAEYYCYLSGKRRQTSIGLALAG